MEQIKLTQKEKDDLRAMALRLCLMGFLLLLLNLFFAGNGILMGLEAHGNSKWISAFTVPLSFWGVYFGFKMIQRAREIYEALD